MMLNPRLSIIIVNWNTSGLLKSCLDSLFNGEIKYSFEVIVVDNNSLDDSVQMLENRFPNVRLIQNKHNIGFAKANNQGIQNSNGEYILLLNSDTEILKVDILEKWIDFMDSHEQAGASGCKLVFPDGSHQVGDAGFKPGVFTAFNHAFFLSKICPALFKGVFVCSKKINQPQEVDWISGADLMLRKSILKEVGLLDESIFMFAEDVEFGCRIKENGYKVFYLPYFNIIHLQGGSHKDGPENISCLWLQNLRYIYGINKKNTLFLFDFFMIIGMYLRMVLYFLAYIFTKNEKYNKKSKHMAIYGTYLCNTFGVTPAKEKAR
ncbi:MAG: glycosyltransferase family 2 protein [Candidatus Omnitrophota bacterium]